MNELNFSEQEFIELIESGELTDEMKNAFNAVDWVNVWNDLGSSKKDLEILCRLLALREGKITDADRAWAQQSIEAHEKRKSMEG